MSPALCDAALSITGSGGLLSTLTHTSAFVRPEGEDGEWYRYHELFRELLQSLARRQAPDMIDPVLSRAAAWHELHGDPGEAFEYAHDAAIWRVPGGFFFITLIGSFLAGRSTPLAPGLRCTPEELASDPLLSLGGAWVALMSGDAVEARRLASATDTADDLDAPSPDG